MSGGDGVWAHDHIGAAAILPGEEVWDNDQVAAAMLADMEDHLYGLLRWLRAEDFALVVADWSWDRCMDFPKGLAPREFETVEHPLACAEAHIEYRALFEQRAQEYMQAHGIEEAQILEFAEIYLARLRHGEAGVCDAIEGLVASESYPSFFAYMCSMRRRRELAEEALCASGDELHWDDLVRRSLQTDLGDVTVGDDSDVESLD